VLRLSDGSAPIRGHFLARGGGALFLACDLYSGALLLLVGGPGGAKVVLHSPLARPVGAS